MNDNIEGLIVIKKGVPQAFFLYTVDESKCILLNTMFSLATGSSEEIMIYGMNALKKLSDYFALKYGIKHHNSLITVQENENNQNMLQHFLRAARYSKVTVNIERLPEKETLTLKVV